MVCDRAVFFFSSLVPKTHLVDFPCSRSRAGMQENTHTYVCQGLLQHNLSGIEELQVS